MTDDPTNDAVQLRGEVVLAPNSELVVEAGTRATIICYHEGVCKALELDESGYVVWRLVDGQRSVDAIAGEFATFAASAWAVRREVALEDAQTFLVELVRAGAVGTRPGVTDER
jgi:hypothetical protein